MTYSDWCSNVVYRINVARSRDKTIKPIHGPCRTPDGYDQHHAWRVIYDMGTSAEQFAAELIAEQKTGRLFA